jgi:CheY-like chemotaxis protein
VAPLVAEIHTRHQASLHSKGISCDIDIRPDMRWLADRVLIGEVFDNLFSNALKFCDQGDRILVCQVQQDTVEFRDSGPGVLEAFRAGLFRHEIKTVGRGSRGEVGTGMGLSHCADIMAAHGGSIELLASDRGARFAIRLPRHERTVLIVDDQAAHRAMIRASIARVGSYDILEAANGRDALDLVEGTLPDIAVIDLEMPTMDGRLLIEALRSREDTRDLPIIVATSYLHGDVDTVAALTAELVGLGANHVAVKPIHSENFNRTFLHLMGDVGGA